MEYFGYNSYYMSGHSKWSTIKRKKEATDQARGKVFSKLSRAISIAIKTGGGANPDSNYKLRMAIDAARAENMPKVNIDRVLAKADEGGEINEIMYEGFGPESVGIVIETATDNKNRTAQEMKGLFDRAGGSMGGPGSVSYNFVQKGYLLVEKQGNPEEQELALIDLGVDDVEESNEGIETYTDPTKVFSTKEALEKNGFTVTRAELIMKPKLFQMVSDEQKAQKIINLLETLENHDDVQKVYSNLDLSDEIARKLAS